MRLLLDTHTFLWAISDEPRLGPRSRDLITAEASSVLISHVSLWEIANKHALARSDMPLSAAQAIPWAQECGFELLPRDLPLLLTLEPVCLARLDEWLNNRLTAKLSSPDGHSTT